jgi:integrase
MCKPHQCRPFADSGIRTIHFILSGALGSAVRWGWLGVNPAATARKPALPAAKPKPPTVEEAARLINEAWTRDADWGTFVWTATTTGARRGEMCGLRWHHLDLDAGVAHIERAIGKDEDGRWIEKDTKSHQQRRVVLDPETKILLLAQRARHELAATQLGFPFNPRGYVFSLAPDHSTYLIPDTATQRYDRLAERLGINTTLHKLRAYAATELLNGGVDVRAVAGRLGHGSGGAMTLRAYAAWLAEADQRAAPILAGRMPDLPAAMDVSPTASGWASTAAQDETPPAGPYQRIARDLEGAVAAGLLTSGDRLPTIKDLAARYGVAVATAHRAIAKLQTMGLIDVSRGRRAVVR